jgi:hypothetical protein
MLGFSLELFFDPKIEATCFSETLNGFQRTVRCYIPEDRTAHALAERTPNPTYATLIETFVPCVLFVTTRIPHFALGLMAILNVSL